jgi:hypothetical protein
LPRFPTSKAHFRRRKLKLQVAHLGLKTLKKGNYQTTNVGTTQVSINCKINGTLTQVHTSTPRELLTESVFSSESRSSSISFYSPSSTRVCAAPTRMSFTMSSYRCFYGVVVISLCLLKMDGVYARDMYVKNIDTPADTIVSPLSLLPGSLYFFERIATPPTNSSLMRIPSYACRHWGFRFQISSDGSKLGRSRVDYILFCFVTMLGTLARVRAPYRFNFKAKGCAFAFQTFPVFVLWTQEREGALNLASGVSKPHNLTGTQSVHRPALQVRACTHDLYELILLVTLTSPCI